MKMPKKADKPMDAIRLLKTDHRKVEDLFKKFENARGSAQKEKLAHDICMELIIHTMIEEEIFYPTFRGKIDADLLDEAYVEHDGAKLLIVEIMNSSANADFYDAKVKVLSEEIKHHVKEEEKVLKGMFAQARRTNVDLDKLGARMMARKEELMATFKKKGLPAPETRTFQGGKVIHGQPLRKAA